MKKEILICFKCRKEIDPKSNYYSFLEFNKGKFIRADHSHKECWDTFLKKIGDTTEAMGIVRGLKGYLTKLGMVEPEEFMIK